MCNIKLKDISKCHTGQLLELQENTTPFDYDKLQAIIDHQDAIDAHQQPQTEFPYYGEIICTPTKELSDSELCHHELVMSEIDLSSLFDSYPSAVAG